VIDHELLHLLYYNYLAQVHSFSEKQLKSLRVWDFSEVINVVLQGQSDWVDVFGVKAQPYPQHEKFYEEVLQVWNENNDIDYLIERFLK